MSKKKKYYVVWNGLNPGIYHSWDDCQAQIKGVKGAVYKSFDSQEEAERAYASPAYEYVAPSNSPKEENSKSAMPAATPLRPGIGTYALAVDAACSGNPGVMEYRGVDTATGREIFRMGPFSHATNNIGEFLALVHGLALLKQHNKTMPIYSDSVNAMAWVRAKKCRTKLARTEQNIEVFNLIARAERWLEDNHYTTKIIKWDTPNWGEIPADFGRK